MYETEMLFITQRQWRDKKVWETRILRIVSWDMGEGKGGERSEEGREGDSSAATSDD
jgi:hypothetical protein